MFSIEKKIIELLEKNLFIVVAVVGSLVALLLRITEYPFISSDMEGFLIGWFGQIEQLGKIKALNTQVGNYSVAYQTLIAIMTYIPVNMVYQYKNLSVFFDYVLALGVSIYTYKLTLNKNKALFAYVITLFLPIVFINSALWGQCDSIYAAFAVWSLVFFGESKYKRAFILYGLSCAFKLQAIFLLPFFLFAYVRKKDFSIINFLIVPAVMEIVCIPAMCVGRGIKAAFSVYFYQTESCDKMYFSYPSFWSIISKVTDPQTSNAYIGALKVAAILLTFAVLALLMVWIINKNISITAENALFISFIIVYTCVLFLPGMHERYGFLYEMLAIVIAIVYTKTVIPVALMYSLTCITYGISLFAEAEINAVMGIVNVLVYMIMIKLIMARILSTPQ